MMFPTNCYNEFNEQTPCDLDIDYAHFKMINNANVNSIDISQTLKLNGLFGTPENLITGDFRNYSTYNAYFELNFDDSYGGIIGQEYVPVYTIIRVSSDNTTRWFSVNLVPVEDFLNPAEIAPASEYI